jgi:hypothetical protein
MAISVISQPDSLCFSGNLPKIVVESNAQVRIKLSTGANVLLDETYTPDFYYRVSIDIADIVINELEFTFPTATNVTVQQNIIKKFTISINETYTSEFTALRCGVKDLGIAPAEFMRKNFLTWQPREKKITLSQPEYLTYAAQQTCWLFVTAYFADGTKQNISVTQMTAGNVYTADINRLLNSLPQVAVQAEAVVASANSISSVKVSKYQYYATVPELPDEQYFLFENSLGGLDTVRCTGDNN